MQGRWLLTILALLLVGCTSEKDDVRAYLDATSKLGREIQPMLNRWVETPDPGQGAPVGQFVAATKALLKECQTLQTEFTLVTVVPARARPLHDSYKKLLANIHIALQNDLSVAAYQGHDKARFKELADQYAEVTNAIVAEQDTNARLRKELMAFIQ